MARCLFVCVCVFNSQELPGFVPGSLLTRAQATSKVNEQRRAYQVSQHHNTQHKHTHRANAAADLSPCVPPLLQVDLLQRQLKTLTQRLTEAQHKSWQAQRMIRSSTPPPSLSASQSPKHHSHHSHHHTQQQQQQGEEGEDPPLYHLHRSESMTQLPSKPRESMIALGMGSEFVRERRERLHGEASRGEEGAKALVDRIVELEDELRSYQVRGCLRCVLLVCSIVSLCVCGPCSNKQDDREMMRRESGVLEGFQRQLVDAKLRSMRWQTHTHTHTHTYHTIFGVCVQRVGRSPGREGGTGAIGQEK